MLLRRKTINILKEMLIKHGIHQSKFSIRIGMAAGYINKICNQGKIPSPTAMSRIVNGLNELSGEKYLVKDIFPTFINGE